MCRFFLLLGGQSQKDADMAQLWELPSLKPERYVILPGDHTRVYDDIPGCSRDTSCDKGKTLYCNLSSKLLQGFIVNSTDLSLF